MFGNTGTPLTPKNRWKSNLQNMNSKKHCVHTNRKVSPAMRDGEFFQNGVCIVGSRMTRTTFVATSQMHSHDSPCATHTYQVTVPEGHGCGWQ